jgi:hypothetical protein
MKTEEGMEAESRGTTRASKRITVFMRFCISAGWPCMPSAAPSSTVRRKVAPASTGSR